MCRDLLDLSDDLGGLDDCAALFNPATTKDDDDGHHGRDMTDEGDASVGGGLRTTTNVRAGVERHVEVFPGVAMLVTTQRRIQRGQGRSEDDNCDPSSSSPLSSSSYDQLWVQVPSQRSHLLVRLVAWIPRPDDKVQSPATESRANPAMFGMPCKPLSSL